MGLNIIDRCYRLLFKEIESAEYSKDELALLSSDFLYYGRYLNPESRPYFEKTVFPQIRNAIEYFELSKDPKKNVLDLGCGLGMQSIIFAACGAKVVAVDIYEAGINLAKKRAAFYEKALGRKLDIEFIQADFRKAKPVLEKYQFNAVFSMSAFSYMLPIQSAVDCLKSITASDAKIFLYEENKQSIFGWMTKFKTIPLHKEITKHFNHYGFKKEGIDGVCSIPPKLWRVKGLLTLVEKLNFLTSKLTFLSFSYSLRIKKEA